MDDILSQIIAYAPDKIDTRMIKSQAATGPRFTEHGPRTTDAV